MLQSVPTAWLVGVFREGLWGQEYWCGGDSDNGGAVLHVAQRTSGG